MYKSIIRPILFLFSPEKAHKISFLIFKLLLKIPFVGLIFKKIFVYENPKLEQHLFGLTFKNPVGLAAGFDKDAELIEPLSHLGFGFIEIGTLTPKPQDGNPKPRLFRLPEDKALINRMGFNNKGVETAVQRLKNRKTKVLIGGNIGKNKTTPNENATADYLACFDALYDVVDYFIVNVSSPNTPNLRALQEKKPLMELLGKLQQRNKQQSKPKPILLKIAPDLTNLQLDDIIEIVATTKIAGVIANNTTIERENLQTSAATLNAIGAGGLSGKPLRNRATEVIKYLFEKSDRKLKIIGVGGIHSPQDALEKIEAGACLVQLYTGFIYEGAGLIKKINKLLVERKN